MKTQSQIITFMKVCKGNILLNSILYNPINAEFTHDDHVLSIEMVKDMLKNNLIKHTNIIELQGTKYLRYILC